MLLSESASAQLQLVSTTGTQANPVFHYDITVTDTGTTNIGTFWFSWVPEENFLPTSPAAASSPAGWSATITGFGNSIDGAGIEWVATSNAITPGHSLSGFDFTTSDSPSALAANSPAHPGLPVLTAFVYSGGPFSDLGSQVSVTTVAAQVASMTTLATSAPTITAGDSLTLTATVAPAAGSGATPTGTVTFFEGSNNLGTSQVQSDGAAALVTAALPSGTLSLTAQYSGDSAYTGSTSAAITQIVTPAGTAATTVALSSSAPAPAPGTPVTVNATVSAVTSNGSTPSGNVSFFDNGAPAGEAALVDGVAQVPLTLAVGVHAITATYAGDATFAGSTSTAGVTETVTAAPTLSAAIAKDTLPSVFVPGDRGLVALQLTNAASILERGTVAIQAFLTP
ncbi:MAG TPA: Ig-like domain-containing protein, partial [Tepidisphaeraceae bacterium]|nr:Ig-like domain-containing protein [Tepidisphaeraceae bacterium]